MYAISRIIHVKRVGNTPSKEHCAEETLMFISYVTANQDTNGTTFYIIYNMYSTYFFRYINIIKTQEKR